MRILLVSNLYPPYAVGGYERLAAWVAGGLRERGHTVDVLTGRGPLLAGSPDVHPDLDLDLPALQAAHFAEGISFPAGLREGLRRHVFNVRNFRAARRLLEGSPPDVVSFWNPAFVTFSPLLAARRRGVPAVVHLSDTAANPFRNPHPPAFPPGLVPAGRLAVDALLRLSAARRFVVPSAFLRERFVRGEGLPGNRVTVMPWPVPPTAAAAAPPPRAAAASRFLFVGSLAPEKGARVLIEAFRDAWGARPELTLTLIGDASRAERERLGASATGLPILFRGRLEHEAVIREYASHDVLVFPSVWDEPFAIVPLEAAARGLAVIATTAGGTPEAFTDGETGRLVPPGDPVALTRAILELAGNPALARRLAEAGRSHVARTYDFSSFLDRLERLYRGEGSPA
jgi:glycogen synthase